MEIRRTGQRTTPTGLNGVITSSSMTDLAADIVIIGSGIGGATTALALAQSGARVVVLERGRRMVSEPQNWSPQAVFIERRYKPTEMWRDGNGRSFAPGVHYMVGGNSKVYGASLPRFREQDFEVIEHRDGTSPAWPFTYADIEPYYAQAERIYRVHGTTGEDPTEPWRSTPYPFPAMAHEPYIADLAQRLRSSGVHPAANSMGLDYGTDGTCIRCATCDGFPCRIGAKSDAENCALTPAIATGNVQLLEGAMVRRIVAVDGTVDHLLVDTTNGEIKIHARSFVLSAGAVNSAALLLGSGVANSSGMVGRNFMMHNNAHIAAVDLRHRNDVVFQKTLSVNDWYLDGGDGYPLGTLQLIGKVQGVMMKSWATKVPLALLNGIASRSVEWLVMAEDLPDPNNRVSVNASGQITTTRVARGLSTHRLLLKRAKGLLRGSGYDAIFTQHFDISMNSHQCGTVRAGDDPATSVVDPWCRSHDLSNLWVIDGGFFPSSAAMNPALTIAAQALRCVAESSLGH